MKTIRQNIKTNANILGDSHFILTNRKKFSLFSIAPAVVLVVYRSNFLSPAGGERIYVCMYDCVCHIVVVAVGY